MSKRILLYGTGNTSEWYLNNYNFKENEIEVAGIVETNKSTEKWGGHQVYELTEINNIQFDELWLTNCSFDTFVNAISVGIQKNRIVICTKSIFFEYKNCFDEDIKYHSVEAEKYEQYTNSRHALLKTYTADREQLVYYTTTMLNASGGVTFYNEDYFRYATFQMIAEEIKRNKIQGDVAELGVFQGRFARCINNEFYDRKLFLFDTFEGFTNKDITLEINRGYTPRKRFEEGEVYSETSVDYVLSIMPNPDKCVVRKGYFPDTIPDDEIKYAFVSVDCDLYSPTLEALRYFYPRLSEGGYMMVHDYAHDDHFLGVKEAINDFEKESGIIRKVPLADVSGTLVVCK